MPVEEPHRIEFTHDPDAGSEKESAGVEGWYALRPAPKGTHLKTSMEISVELPFPGITRPAVNAAMKAVVALMGQRFSSNLPHHLRQILGESFDRTYGCMLQATIQEVMAVCRSEPSRRPRPRCSGTT